METFFIIADIHGFFTPTIEALKEKGFEENNQNHHVILCGDAFDRGREPLQVLNFLQKLQTQNRLVYIRGNHEDLLERCYVNIMREGLPNGRHDYSNGTVQTIADICQDAIITDFLNSVSPMPISLRFEMRKKLSPILDFINDTCINYYELGKMVFVHGWVPICAYLGRDEIPKDWESETYDWESARWANGADRWAQGHRLKDKIIVCGHWHTSYANSKFKKLGPEFPSKKDKEELKKMFAPFCGEGIIMLDACTAYSGIVNVMRLDLEEEE